MINKVSVVIRNKNQAVALQFLLQNLNTRYKEYIDEIIVLDNQSNDRSKEITLENGGKFLTIDKFSYGGSANLGAQSASNDIIVMFSAHAYPVSHDFFEQIILRFNNNGNLAGVRCLHNPNDFKNYIRNISSDIDPNRSGLIFCGSAFNKRVWEKHNFDENVRTFEDKEWTLRVLKYGYDIEFAPAIFCYEIKRTRDQNFFRFKNEIIGGYQLWHHQLSLKSSINHFLGSLYITIKYFIQDIYYTFRRLIFMIQFILGTPGKY